MALLCVLVHLQTTPEEVSFFMNVGTLKKHANRFKVSVSEVHSFTMVETENKATLRQLYKALEK